MKEEAKKNDEEDERQQEILDLPHLIYHGIQSSRS
jgi:hypothetical protein